MLQIFKKVISERVSDNVEKIISVTSGVAASYKKAEKAKLTRIVKLQRK